MEADNNSAYAQWVEESAQPPKRGWPVLTTLIGSLCVLIAAGSGSGEWAGLNSAEAMGRLFGAVLGVPGIIWGICYAITYRHGGWGWRIRSAVLFVVLALIGGLWAIGSRGVAIQEESDAITMISERVFEASPDGSIPDDLPTDSVSPFQRMQAALANDHFAELRAFEAEARATGVEAMLAMQGLSHRSPFLSQCGRMAAMEQLALGNRGGAARHIAAAQAIGERAIAAGELSRADFDYVFQTMNEGERAIHDRIWQIEAETMRRAAAMCRTLARRDWESGADGQVLFWSEADANRVNGEIDRLQALNTELNGIRAANRTRANAAADQVRDRQTAR